MPTVEMAAHLNAWGDRSSCWFPAEFRLRGIDLEHLADAFSKEPECWTLFRGMVEEVLPVATQVERETAEEN